MANPNPSPATRFKKGDQGNPRGRPRGRSVTARLRDLLDQPAPAADGEKKKRGGPPAADALASVILQAALAGDFRFVKELLDRTEGVVRPMPDKEDEPEDAPLDAHGNTIDP